MRNSKEQYWDTATNRRVVVGRHDKMLVLIPYDIIDDIILPVMQKR